MPRRSSGGGRSSGGMGRSGGFSRSRSTSRSPGYSSNTGYRSSTSSQSYKSPYTSNPTSTPARPGIGLGGMGMGSAVATGMALGGGSALGHHIVGGMLGSHGNQVTASQDPYLPQQQFSGETRPAMTQEEDKQQLIKSNPCYEYNIKFVECLRENSNDISRCQNIFSDLTSCEKSLV